MENITLCAKVWCVSLSGTIPLGYKYEADKHSAETHQIPVPPEEFGGETDYAKIFISVKRFVLVSTEQSYKTVSSKYFCFKHCSF